VADGLDDCERLLLQDLPPEVAEQFSTLRVAISTLTTNLDLVRENATARDAGAALVTSTLTTLETV